MVEFSEKIAVVTGGGTGMGRELTRQLAAEGCQVAICDVSAATMAETLSMCRAESPDSLVSSFVADVSQEPELMAFRDHIQAAHATDHIDFLFNNAGIGGAGSMIKDDRAEWERVFAVCWGGVYLGVRTFLPMLVRSPDSHIVNTSSVNGFYARQGEHPCTAYSAAKFAVKGFSEALITDLQLNAPNVKVSVVMPGYIGTSIVFNSGAYLGRDPRHLDDQQVALIRQQLESDNHPAAATSDEEIRSRMVAMAERFRDDAPMTAGEAATVILDGVRAGRWRILVGENARLLDEAVRRDPDGSYAPGFAEASRNQVQHSPDV